MLRILFATLLVVSTSAFAGAINNRHGSSISAPIPYYPCKNVNLRGRKTIDLVKLSGTWYNVAMSLHTPSTTTVEAQQKVISQTIGCVRSRLNLHNAYNLSLTQDIVFRQVINDTSMFPPNANISSDKHEVHYAVPTRTANSTMLDDAHWIEEAYTKQLGVFSSDFYTIAADYRDYSLWYLCIAPPNVPQIEQWGVWSRENLKLNNVQKLIFKARARLAGIDIAFRDHLYDFAQDMCF